MISIIVSDGLNFLPALESESVVVKGGQVIKNGDKRLVVGSDCEITGAFDVVIMHGKLRQDLKKCLSRDTVLFVSSSDGEALNSLTELNCVVVTVGFSERDTVCLSSVIDGRCSAGIQRNIPLGNKCIEMQEIVFDVESESDLFSEVCGRLTLLT